MNKLKRALAIAKNVIELCKDDDTAVLEDIREIVDRTERQIKTGIDISGVHAVVICNLLTESCSSLLSSKKVSVLC